MANQIDLKIMTPEGIFWKAPVDIVTVKTTEGYIGLQKAGLPIVASIAISELHINAEGTKDYKVCAIDGGLVFSDGNEVSIITDGILYKENIDLARAEKSKKEAELKLKAQANADEHFKARLALEKAVNKINVKSGN